MKAHPLADSLPMLGPEEFRVLVESIRKHGQVEPIIVADGLIVDGRNRMEACESLGIPPKTAKYRGGLAVEDYIWAKNIARRHLTDDQKAAAVTRWEEFERARAKERQRESGGPNPGAVLRKSEEPVGTVNEILAEKAGVSRNKVDQALAVKRADEESDANLLEKVEGGEMKLAEAHAQAVKPKPPKNRKRQRTKWDLHDFTARSRMWVFDQFKLVPERDRDTFAKNLRQARDDNPRGICLVGNRTRTRRIRCGVCAHGPLHQRAGWCD